MQDSVATPELVMLVGVRIHEVLLLARLISPLNPWSAEMVRVELPVLLTLSVINDGAAAIAKSWIVYVTVVA